MREFPMGTVTLLFIDIEGSTRLLQHAGERYTSLLEACRSVLRATFHEWNGHEVDTQGDAFFVTFARATDAVAAAVACQRALESHAWPEEVTVRVRMGLHTGEPQLSSEGYVGLDVHRAARIMSAGHGGQVLLSQTTRDLVEHDLPTEVSLRDLGVHRLKDLASPSHLYQLVIAGLEADFPPLRTLDSYAHNLPIQPTPFIGREKEVDAIQQQLRRQEVRLLTLTGPGGVGKTRLGLQVAAESSDQFTDGTWFVSLAPLSDPDLVIPTIAETLHVREAAGRSQLEQLKALLREKQLLLLLDNFEHVVSAAMQVADLLGACPQLKVLVTSREALHVRAEREFPVPTLAVPDVKQLPNLAALSQYEAVALFIERAQAVKPEFQVTNTNATAVAEICSRLDGLPLAIELAAARIKVFSPQALLARLGQRFTVLTSGARDVPSRQQTLRKTIQWSYDLLSAEEQRLFLRFSVFVGGGTLEAIEAVYAALDDGAGQVLEGVASLLDKSLLQQTEQEGEEPRLTMLETIREYGLECLRECGEVHTGQRAHALYYLALAEEAEPRLQGEQQAVWLERLEREHNNLRAAMQWLLEQGEDGHGRAMALRLGGALRRFWLMHGHWSEGRDFLERALLGSQGVAAAVRAKALIAAANLANMLSDNDRVEALCEESLALCRELGDTRGIAHSLRLLGVAAWRRGSLDAARSLNEGALALFRESGDNEGATLSFFNLAWILIHQGEYAGGRALLEESLAMHRALGSKWGMAISLLGLADVLFASQGDQAIVRSLLEEGLALSREVGDKEAIADSFVLSGQLALNQGDTATASSLAEESLVLNREIGKLEGVAESLWLLARVATVQGDPAAARALYEQSLAIATEGYYKWDIAFSLDGLAGLVAAQGELAWAAELWGAAESWREATSSPLLPVYLMQYEQSVATARAQLGEKDFDAAWAKGRSMTPEQALAAQGPVTLSQPLPTAPSTTPPAKPSITYPNGLTIREVEVLRLVAQGMTNEQVAEQLVVSPRTVSTHLTSIYNKLGVNSRSAATRFAVEHQLV
jgi:predicted ATPase/class 3 adenylate cyclase/DNA-binding CsgD family transcriptional regulator